MTGTIVKVSERVDNGKRRNHLRVLETIELEGFKNLETIRTELKIYNKSRNILECFKEQSEHPR